METQIKEKRKKGLEKPACVNTYRTEIFEDRIVLEFGKFIDETINNPEEEIVNVVSSVNFDPKMLFGIVNQLVSDGFAYEEKYQKDIGFTLKKQKKTKSKEKVKQND